MSIFKKLDIPDSSKHAITNGIFDAITNDIPEIIQENNLPTTVGIGQFRWNFINRNISENLGGDFQGTYCKRGSWKFLLLYERNTKFTFSIISEKNLKKLKKHLPEGMHYLESLLSKNSKLEPMDGQLCVLGFESFTKQRDKTEIDKLYEQLTKEFSGVINNHILIVFDYEFNRVISVRAEVLNTNMQVAFSEDWSHFLEKIFYKDTSIIKEMIEDEEEPIVKLKKVSDPDNNSAPNVALHEDRKTSKE